jgi:hypothetical protein
MLTALRSRAARLLAGISVLAAFAVAVIGAPAASALIAPDGQYANPQKIQPAATSAEHLGSGSGLAIWLVVVIALAALAAGVVLAELARSLMRRTAPRTYLVG